MRRLCTPCRPIRPTSLNAFGPDNIAEPFKIFGVMGQQVRYAIKAVRRTPVACVQSSSDAIRQGYCSC
jgi:hypothetical protein